MEKAYEPTKAYKQSKLCNILFTNQLSKVLDERGVSAYAVSPGIVLTNLARWTIKQSRRALLLYILFYPIVWFLLRTPKQGSQTSIYCAVEPSLRPARGFYFRNCEAVPLKKHASSEADSARLWNLSEQMVKKWL